MGLMKAFDGTKQKEKVLNGSPDLEPVFFPSLDEFQPGIIVYYILLRTAVKN